MKIKFFHKAWVVAFATMALFGLWWAADTTLAQGPVGRAPRSVSPIYTFTYQGRLNDGGGPANGSYDLRFAIYDSETGGNIVGGVMNYPSWPVTDGVFNVNLAPASPMSTVFNGDPRWLLVEVRPGGSLGAYTALPRQPITGVPYAWGLEPGAVISGTATAADSWLLKASLNGTTYPTASAIQGTAATGYAVSGISPNGWGFYGRTDDGIAVSGITLGSSPARGYGGWFQSANGIGVHGESNAPSSWNNFYAAGVEGVSTYGVGVKGSNLSSGTFSAGVYGTSPNGTGVSGYSANGTGVSGYSSSTTGNTFGVSGYVRSASGQGGHFVNTDTVAGGTVNQVGLWTGTYWGNLIEGHEVDQFGNSIGLHFRVNWDGTVYSDQSYNCGLSGPSCFNTGIGADVAERIDSAVPLTPGDVVEIDPSNPGQYRLSKSAFSTLVAGVVSTNPAMTMNNNDFTDNAARTGADNRALLALVGTVPVKVSAENGEVQPGDLLVASSTPGYAMKAGLNPPVGAIIGKALERLDAGTGVIKMLVMLR